MKKRGVYAAATVALLTASCGDEREFDSAVWRDSAHADPPVRMQMVDDLLESFELSAMTESDIDRLLGPGDSTAYFSSYDRVYRLGRERGPLSIDSEWLVLRFDSAGRVAEHRILTD